ncbi:energy-coupling factor transporter transmembrane component T family protein [Chloroflexota bacterium]
MTSFKYRDKETLIHKLNPFSKLGWIISIIILALVLDNLFFLLMLFLATLPLVKVARVGMEWRAFMKIALYLSAAVIIINAVVSSYGNHVIFEIPWQFPILGAPILTLEAIIYGVAMSLRLLAIISAFALLTLTVNPDDMMLAMIKMKLPYKSVLVTSLSTRFVPTLLEDVDRITDVQRSRGLELDKGRLISRIKSRSSIVTALLSNSLERATQVSEAMESRAFGTGRHRTFYRNINFTYIDILALVLTLLPAALGIFMAVNGYGQSEYYPSFSGMNLSQGEGWLLGLMGLLLIALLPLAYLKQRIDLD